MNYENQKNKINSNSETQRAEISADKLFDVANKINPSTESESQKCEMFKNAAIEITNGNYDKSQRILESSAQWDDNLRNVASEVNNLDLEKKGVNPMSFEGAQKTITGYARELEKMSKEPNGKIKDLESAMDLDNIVSDTSESGIEGIDNALEYIEGTLKSTNNIAENILNSDISTSKDKVEFLKTWQEKRSIRDALYQEKQKRIEQIGQSQQVSGDLEKGRESTIRNLKNLYTQAGVPENTPSRQEFFAKTQNMSEGELHFLNSELQKTAGDFNISGNKKVLDGQLMNLSSKSFKFDDVTERQKTKDQKKIKKIHEELGIESQNEEETPEFGQTTTERSSKTSGMNEEEIEKNRKRLEKLMPSSIPQKGERIIEPQSTGKKIPKQEKETPNLEKLFFFKEATNSLNSPDKNSYTQEKGFAAVTEVFKKLYPDAKRFAARVETLLHDFHSVQAETQRTRPNENKSTRKIIAGKLFVDKLPQSERQAIEKFLDENSDKVGGGGKKGESGIVYKPVFVLPHFFNYIEKLIK